MSTYGYIKHDELSSGYAISHHGIKGQKWGVRRFQNPDGSLTEEGRARYRISDKEYSTAKKLYKGKGRYSVPLYSNLVKGSYDNAKKNVEAILKYDAMRSEAENGKNPGYFNAGRQGLNPVINTIHHFKDKNGKIALSYAEVPNIGEVYTKGSGNFNDLDLNKLFKKIPKGLQIQENRNETKQQVKNTVKGTKISKGVNYLKEQLIGPNMVDDPELVQLVAYEAQDLYKLSDEEVDKIIDEFNKK